MEKTIVDALTVKFLKFVAINRGVQTKLKFDPPAQTIRSGRPNAGDWSAVGFYSLKPKTASRLVGLRLRNRYFNRLNRKGMIENVFQRSSKILDPLMANVDHFLVLFLLEQLGLKPFALTRFLVKAESTRILLTLALNKSELVDEEVSFLNSLVLVCFCSFMVGKI